MNRRWAVGGVLVAMALAVGTGRLWAGEEKKTEAKGSIAVGTLTGDALLAKATVSLQRAVAMALKAAPGRVWKAELEAEDGFLIYTVQIAVPGGAWKEVNIDAGTGKVLAVEKGDVEEFGKPEGAGGGKDGDKD